MENKDDNQEKYRVNRDDDEKCGIAWQGWRTKAGKERETR